jgi:hypothetical protein
MSEQPWFDIPVVYNNGRRAIVAVERAPPESVRSQRRSIGQCHDATIMAAVSSRDFGPTPVGLFFASLMEQDFPQSVNRRSRN